jgi:hypothetical protein
MLPYQFGDAASSRGLFTRTESGKEGLPNYDIRMAKGEDVASYLESARNSVAKNAAAVADIRDGFVRGEQDLRSRLPQVKFEYNEDIRNPEVITPDVWKSRMEYLTQPTSGKHSEVLRSFLKENNDLVGVSDQQADDLVVVADYTNPNGNMSFAHLEQRINGVPVFRGEVKAGFTKDGRMIRVINNLAPGLDYGSLSNDFGDPAAAVKAAAPLMKYELQPIDLQRNDAASSDIKVVFGNGDWATTAEKMYFPTEPGVAVPAWRVLIWKPVDVYYVIVDARTGTMLWRKDLTNDQTQSATYQIYRNSNSLIGAADNPAPLSPGPLNPTSNTQGAITSRTNVTLIGNEAPYTFNNNGWITDGANITDGNNVEAGIDRDGTNGVDAPQTGSPNRVFDSTWNPPPGNPAPGDDPLTAQAQRGSVIQMFYVMNRYHDELYRLGFTEQARNYQASNFGRGGAENDRISAEGQDSSGTNNANFSIVADGTRGRMQMYLWNGPTPDYDGTGDAEVIIHEVTHGTSQRLHGNAAGLSNNMSAGMGEGWGDFYGYTMLAEASDPIDGVYTTGGYATYLLSGMQSNYYYGIRRFPRAPITFTGGPNNLPHNPFTFKHLNAGCDTFLGTTSTAVSSAFPRNPVVATSGSCDQVHNAGEVWSSALWEVRNRMVSRLGFATGTSRVLQVVTDGMKLAPLNPTFLQERDAIIAAAAALPIVPEATADVGDVREGFRVRGMGFSAAVIATSPANVTEAFDVPNAIFTNPNSVSDSVGDNDGFPESGENVLVSIPVTNNSGNGTINNVSISITGGGTVNYGNIADGATTTMQVPYTVPGGATCGSDHTITITGTTALGAMNPRTFTFRLGVPVGGAPVTFSNNTAMTLGPDAGVSVPYGTAINVSGLTGNKIMKVELTGVTHTFPGDLDFLLVGPGGQKYIMLSDSGGSGDVTNFNMVLKDAAAAQPSTSQWVAGEFKPYNTGSNDPFAAPAPAGPYTNAAPAGSDTFTSVFGTTGANLNGTWTLYAVDDANIDGGAIAGWKLTFEANDYVCSLVNVRSRADFDGDGKTDFSVFRPSEGNWYLQQSQAGFGAVQWGVSTDTSTPGDFNGDGKTDFAVFRPTADPSQPDFYILTTGTFTVTGVSWGLAGDIPVIADYDGDSKSDIAVYRPGDSTFYILYSGGGISVKQYGVSGDVPVGGDFVGDSKADVAIYRPSSHEWWIFNGSGDTVIPFGQAGDVLVPADYNGDNKDDIAVFRPATGQWIYLPSGGGAAVFTSWGSPGDVPSPGDFDGDGKDDQAIYRNGTWWVNASTSGVSVLNFGVATDKSIPRAYLP